MLVSIPVDALYDSEVIAANGFGGGCNVKCGGELNWLPLSVCMAFNGDADCDIICAPPFAAVTLLPAIETIVIIGRLSMFDCVCATLCWPIKICWVFG